MRIVPRGVREIKMNETNARISLNQSDLRTLTTAYIMVHTSCQIPNS